MAIYTKPQIFIGEKIRNNKDWYQEREKPKHRYIYFNTSKTLKKHLIKNLQHKIEKYPKLENKKYDSSAECEMQGVLFWEKLIIKI